MLPTNALQTANALLHASRFAEALAAAAAIRDSPTGGLLYALALAGTGEVAAAAPLLAGIAAANPAHRHPVLDLLPLIPAASAPVHLRAAIAHRPLDAALYTALGVALADLGPVAAAIDAFRRTTELAPADPIGWSNLGKALAAEARFAEAENAFVNACRLAPGNPQIAYNRAIALLKAGRWAEGWAALRIRHALPGRPSPRPGPRLTDLAVAGRTVLLQHEEGLGDTLQFIRYAGLLAERGARVIAAVPPPLRRIVATAPGVAETVDTTALPYYDAWCPLLEVPALFGDTIPASIPYLRAEPMVGALPPGRRIGVAWAGDPGNAIDPLRSLTPATLAPLAARSDVAWISLQKDRPAPGWMHEMPDTRDLADTAGIIAQLDAVVSVDTAVAHLAGALGKPVLLLDRYDACWRWQTGRTDSPWYPTLRIFRQRAPGDWASAIDRLVEAL